MPSAREFFERFPSFPAVEGIMHDSQFMRPSLQTNIINRFANTPLAIVLEKNEAKKQPDGSIAVVDYLQEVSKKLGAHMASSVKAHCHYSPRRAMYDSFYRRESLHTDPLFREHAYKTRELLLQLEPSLTKYRNFEPDDFGVRLTFMPDIPEGIILLRSSMVDDWSSEKFRRESLGYDQFTMIDTNNENKRDSVLFMHIAMFGERSRDSLSAISEQPFTFDEIRSGEVFGVKFEPIWTDVYVHLPDDLRYLLPQEH